MAKCNRGVRASGELVDQGTMLGEFEALKYCIRAEPTFSCIIPPPNTTLLRI